MTERRREQLERLFTRLAPLKRLLWEREERLFNEEPVQLETGAWVWMGEEEWHEEVGKLIRVDRLLVKVMKRLGIYSPPEQEPDEGMPAELLCA